MKVIITGALSPIDLAEKIAKVASETAHKLETEQGVKFTDYQVHEAEVTIKYSIEGLDEPQVLTVEHHEGQPELFTWLLNAETDEKTSNEDESQYDEYTVAKAKGEDVKFKEIESIFDSEDLTFVSEEQFGDMVKETYNHMDGSVVVLIKQDGKLIQEMTLTAKDGGVLH